MNEWRTPGKRSVVRCALNERQVVIALTGGEIVYFEMDASGQLNEYTERKEMSSDVVSMSLGTVPPGEQRSRFLAVGLADQTVRIISLDPSVSRLEYFISSKENFVDTTICSNTCVHVQVVVERMLKINVFFIVVYDWPGHPSATEHAGLASNPRESMHR